MESSSRHEERRLSGERRRRVDRRTAERRTKAVSVDTDRRRPQDRRRALDRRVWPDRRLALGGPDTNPARNQLTCQAPGCGERAIVRPGANGWLCLEHLRLESN